MDNLQIKESDLASFAGLAFVIPILVGTLKKLFRTLVDGREPLICFGLTYAIGLTAKKTIPHAFGGVGWLTLVVSLLIVSGLAAQVHDYAINKVFKGKDDSAPPGGGAGGAGTDATSAGGGAGQPGGDR